MQATERRTIVVTGATGLQGGAVAAQLLPRWLACARVDAQAAEQAYCQSCSIRRRVDMAVMPELMGSARKVYWLSLEDLGTIAAAAFSRPHDFIGRELMLAADVQSIDECRAIYREVLGTNPPRFPLPVWMFERLGFVGKDLAIMWRWLRSTPLEVDPSPTRSLLPEALTVRAWLGKRASQHGPR